MNGPRSEREGHQTRNGRRLGTKAPGHKVAQAATKGTLRRAQRVHAGTGKAAMRADHARAVLTGRAAPVEKMFTVRNSGTKREIVIRATDSDSAVAIALDVPYRLAKSAAKLTATPYFPGGMKN